MTSPFRLSGEKSAPTGAESAGTMRQQPSAALHPRSGGVPALAASERAGGTEQESACGRASIPASIHLRLLELTGHPSTSTSCAVPEAR